MMVGLLTEEQKNQIIGVEYCKDCLFNPIQDANNNWIISIEEINQSSLEWIKNIPLIPNNPVQYNTRGN